MFSHSVSYRIIVHLASTFIYLSIFSPFPFPLALAQNGPPDHTLDDSFKYITRPDIETPRWQTTTYEPDLVTPGYWFVEPYDYLDQALVNGGKWNAPMIFDGNGELIWSGAYLSNQYNTFDFRLSHVLNTTLLTFLYAPNKSAILLDSHFNIVSVLQTSALVGEWENMHELQFVDHGERVLYFFDETVEIGGEVSAAIGLQSGRCRIRENGIREMDLRDGSVVWEWRSLDEVELGESSFLPRGLEEMCLGSEKGWDYIHANSLDKFPNGSGYLMSGRHTDTIYKIAPSGAIVWRLGGSKSNFSADFEFARLHHARILEHNATHTTISFFDNAKAEEDEEAAVPYSRGVVIILHTAAIPMTATLLREYLHPDGVGAYTLGRASMQVLPNGNVFMGWVDGCLHSEHTIDGKIVMEARVKQRWLKTYRSYKFPFVGLPAQPPDIHSAVQTLENDEITTLVHVSWNGATEVASWVLWKSDKSGNNKKCLKSSPRTSFETVLEYPGYAKYVLVEALDRNGESLGQSAGFETLVWSALPVGAVEMEEQWLREDGNLGSGAVKGKSSALGITKISAFWIVCAVVTVAVCQTGCCGRRKSMRWWPRKLQSCSLRKVEADGEDVAFLRRREEEEVIK